MKYMIFKNSALLAFFSVLSLLLAIVRDRLLAMNVGVGPTLDVYNASFRIPDLIYGAILAFVTSGTVVPYLTRENKHGDILDPKIKLASLTMFFVAIIGFLALIIALTLPLFAHFLVPGFTEAQVATFVTTTRLLLLQPIILGVTSLISCLAQMKNQFLLYGLSPLGYSFGIIMGIIFLYPPLGITGLIYGVLLGSVLSFLIQVFSLRGVHIVKAFHHTSFTYIRELAHLAIPRTGTNVTTQLRLLFFHGFATTLGPGVLSAYLFAQKITDAVVQVIQQSVTTASIPVLSRDLIEQKVSDYTHLVRKYVVVLGGLGILAAVIIYFGHDILIRILYGNTGSNELIAYFLMGFLIALPFQMMASYYAVSLYSARDTFGVFITYLLSSLLAVGTVLVFQEKGTSALIYGYLVFWLSNFLIILSLYSRKKL
jgi:putative peptidoglycan lipid II flippase